MGVGGANPARPVLFDLSRGLVSPPRRARIVAKVGLG